MARLETFQSNAAEAPRMRRWVFFALIVSLLFHGGLFLIFQKTQIDNFAMTSAETLAPPRFVVNKVTIDPKLLEEPVEHRIKLPAKLPNQTIAIPDDKPQPKEIQIRPQTTEVASPLLTDKPASAPINWDSLAKNQAESAGRSDKELGSIAAVLLNSSENAPHQPSISLPPGTKQGEGLGGLDGIPGRQSIDDALAKAGTPSGINQPVAMPGGALFEHDKADLRPEAQDALKKIGQLLSLYPKATFVISGHTDWTGTSEYNQRLSERRAVAVKDWLVSTMHIAPERIQTIGRGSSDSIVSADHDVDEQQPNRRVEIVIKTNTK